MSNTAMTRKDLEENLIVKAWKDSSFKQELISEPKVALAKEGIVLPDSIEVKVVEETPNVLYFVIPNPPSDTSTLSEAELESVAGGGTLKIDAVW
mgnify:CR=1 FL=1